MTSTLDQSTDRGPLWPLPIPDPDTRGFWAATAQGVLAVCRCLDCRQWIHAPLERCRTCMGPVEFAPVSGRGTLHTWIAVNRQAVPGPDVPYLVGVAELEEAPSIRITGVLRTATDLRPQVGMPVTIGLEPTAAGDFVAPVILPA
ncbi:hypothetical protein GCM10009547_16590 [Sporichthya brevicatena]|uniref:ChsH2 C-terminal OB-fold domain-containing protein n=1 Tax=Sporichthya brevicatena TaxID=171442 RepID=A0ABN1GNR4_9ACTN